MARAQAVLARLNVVTDTMANQVPMKTLQGWREAAMAKALKWKDAIMVAQVRAGAQARGVSPILFSSNSNDFVAMRQRGVVAVELGKPLSGQVRPRPPAAAPPAASAAAGAVEKGTSLGMAGTFRAGLKAGLEEVVSAENIAAMIPDIVLMVADKAAAREAVRKIKAKFASEGFSKGVAAGVVGWTEEEAAQNLLNHVTDRRLEGMQDPGELIPYNTMLTLAESQENYAVGVGFRYSSSQPLKWKKEMQGKGFEVLRKYGYYFGENPEAFLEYSFIDKLAWVLKPTTDEIVQHAMASKKKLTQPPADIRANIGNKI
jgi:hypothetical protein